MHGYFLSLRLYDAARLISNPFAYNEHREKVVKDKMDKLAESRIRTRKDGMGSVKVNKKLAERLRRDEEREERKRHKGAVVVNDGGEDAEMEVEVEEVEKRKKKKTPSNLLSDSRFKDLFENPEFEVDEGSREFGMLNPSTLASSSSSVRFLLFFDSTEMETD
jgi:ribosome biogenesis protein ENP2